MSNTKPVWSFWGRFTGIGAAICMIIAMPIQYFYPDWFWLSFYSLGAGVFVLLWEFPLPGLTYLGFVYKNFVVRGIMYVLMSGPMFIDAPTTTGALALAATGVIFLIAAFTGEQYIHPSEWQKRRRKQRKSKKAEASEIEHLDTKQPQPVQHETGANRVLGGQSIEPV